MAMFPNDASAAEAVAAARERGIDAAAVLLPVREGALQTDTYDRPIGLISYDYPHAGKLLEIYDALQEELLKRGLPEEDPLSRVRLFTARGTASRDDPVERLLPELSTFYEKHLLDSAVIEPYYARLLTGSIPMDSGFRELRDEWLKPYAQIGEAAAPLSGDNLMRIINGWYYKEQKNN